MSTKEFKQAIASVNLNIDNLIKIAGGEDSTESILQQLKELRQSAASDTFKVLVIGKFSSGKSTMINALLGEPILPERATTATAIITEISYGDTKKAIIYPKPGQWKDGDEPFEVQISDLRNYLLINHNVGESYDPHSNTVEGNVIASPFEKMVINWPLEILKDGVEIVDSPGIDDPTCHGLVASTYLPKAHAIIYVMSGLNPYNNSDVAELTELRSRNFTTPIFLVTRYDNVLEDAENQFDPEEYIREYREKVDFDLKRHTDLAKQEYIDKLGSNGIFYVSSRDAKKAKKAVPFNHELYVSSGYARFEQYLSDYLVKCKGQEMIRGIVSRFNNVANDCISMMNEQLRAADTPLEEFEAKVKDVQKKLKFATEQSKLFVKQFDNELDNIIVNDVMPVVSQLVSSAREKIPEWKESYQCSVSTSILHPKRSAEAIATECQAHFDTCYQNFQIEWVNQVLVPKIDEGIKKAAKKLEERSKSIDATIRDIKISLDLIPDTDTETSSNAAKVTSVIYGLLTFDLFGASAGFTTGFEGLVKGIVTNILINLAVIAVVGTVSLPVIIIGELINLIIVGGTQKNTMVKKVTNKVADAYDSALSDPQTIENVREQIKGGVSEQFTELKKAAKDAAFSEVQAIEKDITMLSEEKKKGEQAVNALKTKLNNNIAAINLLTQNTEKIFNTI